ncbi:hypothetical protein HSX37_16375|uniref:Uncharacterized protein n=1 Tax=Dendrosporobacter quercicolus TaxID=146817 RepID=A0A1G9ZV12_9FIRM|nr:hypothetical protein [Dendrosporobacter quercicolus]NSL49613.1 hypothetical protein [Dendrosporobacter quercicolus DSM 1736]SDN24965.1 hypothetical protein SAMN04488502_11569 [Dendrosporobacter quercicolus]
MSIPYNVTVIEKTEPGELCFYHAVCKISRCNGRNPRTGAIQCLVLKIADAFDDGEDDKESAGE